MCERSDLICLCERLRAMVFARGWAFEKSLPPSHPDNPKVSLAREYSLYFAGRAETSMSIHLCNSGLIWAKLGIN